MDTRFKQLMDPTDKRYDLVLQRSLAYIGKSEAVDHFLSKYGSLRTRSVYAYWLCRFLKWFRAQKDNKAFLLDFLIEDNLLKVFKSDPTDVKTKRFYTDWLHAFVNIHLVKEGRKEATRRLAAAAV